MGLETAHPEVLAKLNKRMTLEQFSRAAEFLRRNEMDVRVFILVQPPYMPAEEALHWAKRSLDFAMDHGATAATLIPTRPGNGVMDDLMAEGQFALPALHTLESAMEYGLGLKAGRVFADLWGLRESCATCHAQRVARLRRDESCGKWCWRGLPVRDAGAPVESRGRPGCGGGRLWRQPDGDDRSSARAFGGAAGKGSSSPRGDWRIDYAAQQPAAGKTVRARMTCRELLRWRNGEAGSGLIRRSRAG